MSDKKQEISDAQLAQQLQNEELLNANRTPRSPSEEIEKKIRDSLGEVAYATYLQHTHGKHHQPLTPTHTDKKNPVININTNKDKSTPITSLTREQRMYRGRIIKGVEEKDKEAKLKANQTQRNREPESATEQQKNHTAVIQLAKNILTNSQYKPTARDLETPEQFCNFLKKTLKNLPTIDNTLTTKKALTLLASILPADNTNVPSEKDISAPETFRAFLVRTLPYNSTILNMPLGNENARLAALKELLTSKINTFACLGYIATLYADNSGAYITQREDAERLRLSLLSQYTHCPTPPILPTTSLGPSPTLPGAISINSPLSKEEYRRFIDLVCKKYQNIWRKFDIDFDFLYATMFDKKLDAKNQIKKYNEIACLQEQYETIFALPLRQMQQEDLLCYEKLRNNLNKFNSKKSAHAATMLMALFIVHYIVKAEGYIVRTSNCSFKAAKNIGSNNQYISQFLEILKEAANTKKDEQAIIESFGKILGGNEEKVKSLQSLQTKRRT